MEVDSGNRNPFCSTNNPDFGLNGAGLDMENLPPLPPSASPEREDLVRGIVGIHVFFLFMAKRTGR